MPVNETKNLSQNWAAAFFDRLIAFNSSSDFPAPYSSGIQYRLEKEKFAASERGRES